RERQRRAGLEELESVERDVARRGDRVRLRVVRDLAADLLAEVAETVDRVDLAAELDAVLDDGELHRRVDVLLVLLGERDFDRLRRRDFAVLDEEVELEAVLEEGELRDLRLDRAVQ